MDACRASNCCHGARSAPWTVVPSERETRVVPELEVAAVEAAVARIVPGAHQRRWRSWISSPQRRPTRQNTPWTKEPSPPNTMNLSISSTDFPHMGKQIHSFFLFSLYSLFPFSIFLLHFLFSFSLFHLHFFVFSFFILLFSFSFTFFRHFFFPSPFLFPFCFF